MTRAAPSHTGSAVPGAGTLTVAPVGGAAARSRRAVEVAGDVLLAAAVVMGFPLVILAIGIPIALVVQLLLWIGRLV